MRFPNWLKSVSAAALLLGGAILLMAPSNTDDPPPDTGGNGNVGGTPPDTIRTSSVACFGASMIVFAVSATTGRDSAVVLQVSQDNVKFFLASQENNSATAALVGYAGQDSLVNGPHTYVAYYVGAGGGGSNDVVLPFPYRYARLRIWKKTGTTITGLKVTAVATYTNSDAPRERESAYATTW